MSEAAARFGRRFRYDPVGFLEAVVPFGRPGAYSTWQGLTEKQRTFFAELGRELASLDWGDSHAGTGVRKPLVARAVCAATEVGKTALMLPGLCFWLMACYPGVRIQFASSSERNAMQQFWPNLLLMLENSVILRELFETAAGGEMWVKGQRNETFLVIRASGLKLAGFHSPSGMVVTLLDECNLITDEEFAGCSGAINERRALLFMFGNPTTLFGFFHDYTHGRLRDQCVTTHVSKKDMPDWDESQDAALAERLGGMDSWKYRAYVLGLPPLEGTLCAVSREAAERAATRGLRDGFEQPLVDYERTPVVVGVDLARLGAASNCAVWRCGVDARSVRPESLVGSETPIAEKVAWLTDVATRPRPPFRAPSAVYLDYTGESGALEEPLKQNGVWHLFRPVVFNHADPTGVHADLRSAMWTGLRHWLDAGGVIRNDPGLVRTLAASRLKTRHNRLAVETKESMGKIAGRGNLDEADALMLSCRQAPMRMPVSLVRERLRPHRSVRPKGLGYGG